MWKGVDRMSVMFFGQYLLQERKINVEQLRQALDLVQKTKISFSNLVEIQAPVTDDFEVHGYPCKTKPHNEIFDVKRKLPLYTKTPKSQSFHCAGYYIINFDNGWMKSYCPKLITLTRNQFEGP